MFRESIYKRYELSLDPPGNKEERSYWFMFRSSKLLLKNFKEKSYNIPFLTQMEVMEISPVRVQYLGKLEEVPCYSAELPPEFNFQRDTSFHDLWSLWGTIDEDLFLLAGRALQIVSWDQSTQYCGGCGQATELVTGERAKICPQCGLLFYPRLSPAVITAVIKGDRILLGRRGGPQSKMYTVIAGFVEPGETLEECLRREVYEEVGIRVKNIQYFGSQPWPFPNSLMIGFTSEYESGDIKVDGAEVPEADWFEASNMPLFPPKISIAHELIDWFIRQHLPR